MTNASPSSFPAVNGGTQIGTLILKPVADGYEARCYRLPPEGGTVPLESAELIWAGLYDKDRNLVRPLGDDPRQTAASPSVTPC